MFSPTAAAALASKARDDDVKDSDHAMHDGHDDSSDAIHDSHEDTADGLEDSFEAADNSTHFANLSS